MKFKFGLVFLAIISIYTIVYYYYNLVISDDDRNNRNKNVIVFDLNGPLEPANQYAEIECRTSARISQIETVLCHHNVAKDQYVSGAIVREGVFEGGIVGKFLIALLKCGQDGVAFDIGANIGQYTLFAAKMNRQVIAVEPFHENILRIHKAARLENSQSKIKLFKMALSNERNQIKLLQPSGDNIGGQSLKSENETIDLNRLDEHSKRYLVRTMLMDDLVAFVPARSEVNKLKGVMKIDIEGFEPYALEKAKNLFDRVAFQHVFMEWGNLKVKVKENLVESMIAFLSSYNLKPFDHSNNLLDKTNWKSWPWDLQWMKANA